MLSCYTIVCICTLLACGPLNTVLTKVVFEINSIGLEGEMKPFHKPWFTTLQMFLGMMPAILAHFVKNYIDTRNRLSEEQKPLLGNKETAEKLEEPSFWVSAMWIGIPSCLDLLGTIVSYLGLMYNSASVFTMMRGSIIVFSAILSVLLLGRKMRTQNWFGVGMCVVAVSLVGTANIMGHSASGGDGRSQATVIFGMVMIVLSQIIQALQLVTEEKLMKNMAIAPFLVVGMEGVWGTLMMLFAALPIVYMLPGNDVGSVENTLDTLVLYENSSRMQSLMGVYVVSIFLTNISGVLVTKALSSVHRTIISAMQTAVVWCVGLIVYYFVDPTISFAEPWTAWSWMQLAGFSLLVVGQGVYAEMIHLPWFKYDDAPVVQKLPLRSPISVRRMIPAPKE